jgi:hypothetical protein
VSQASRQYEDGYILVNTKFATTNHQLGPDEERKYSERFVGEDAYEDEAWTRDEQYERLVLNHFMTAIGEMAKRFPSRHIIIRPHPVENIDTYKQQFRNIPNVHAIRDGSVQEWIVRAGVVIQHDCTTGIESMLLGKPTISYCPVLEEDLIQWLPVMAGYRISSLDELLATIDAHVVQRYEPEHFAPRYDLTLIKQFIANTDFSAADRIVEALHERAAGWEETDLARIAADLPARESGGFVDRTRKLLAAVARPLRTRLPGFGGDAKLKQLKRSKFDKLTFDEVAARVRALQRIENGEADVKIASVGHNAYLLTRAQQPGAEGNCLWIEDSV